MSFWAGKKVLVTGHTGFKGGWLCSWLKMLGADVTGYSLEPLNSPNMFSVAKIKDGMASFYGDVRDKKSFDIIIKDSEPEIIFHLAAQPLVRKSYAEPVETYETNVIGTANLLNSLRTVPSVKTILIITSDKCYENHEWVWGYRENDRLGGKDPYSSSKACVEILVNSFVQSFFKEGTCAIATARAGNVIGGGDWSEDRLVPDIIRAYREKKHPVIRNPEAVRPWQHVLEPLYGYLLLVERLYEMGCDFSGAWNFGPDAGSEVTVKYLSERLAGIFFENPVIVQNSKKHHPYESGILKLDSSKANSLLGWHGRLGLDETIAWTAEWYREYYSDGDMTEMTEKQIRRYMKMGSEACV